MADLTAISSFSYQAFESLVRRFADTVPQLLLRHPETAPLALEIEKLQLASALESRFTVAIIGQMRVGKSTLLNALIGHKLAPTGVNETTATVNWFRYGQGDLCNRFRVHWNDGSTEDLPLSQIAAWIGREVNATRTRALDLFADSVFLKIANIVDTPGTRSTLEQHEQTTQGFLAEKLEAETFKYGGRADAVIFAINPVARETDRDLLQLFGERTRLPGASAYNSIAVVQKWEHLEPDPLREVARKCDRLREQLQGKVAEVIPTSGLLANLAVDLPLATWTAIARLATASDAEAVRYLLRAPNYFCREQAGIVLDMAEREQLTKHLEWPALRFAVQLAQARRIDDGAALRQAILDASGIEKLKTVLQQRFFSLAGLIQAGTVLRKAWTPCDVALLKLQQSVQQRQQDLTLGQQATDLLQAKATNDSTLSPVLGYVNRSLSAVRNDLQQLEDLRAELDAIRTQAAGNFQFLDRDIGCLKNLESLGEEAEISEEEKAELYRLFGGNGPDIWRRLGLLSADAVNTTTIDKVWDRQDYWAGRKAHTTGVVLSICEHALECLEKILGTLSENPEN